MKKIILLFFILFVQFYLQAQNQEKITGDFKIYHVKIRLRTQEKIKGYLFAVTDSTITVSNSPYKNDYKVGNYKTTVYLRSQIEWVKAYYKSGGFAGGVIGLLIGGGVGYKAGQARRKRILFNRKNLPTKGLFVGSALGATIGALIGRRGVSRVSNSTQRTIRRLKARAIKKN